MDVQKLASWRMKGSREGHDIWIKNFRLERCPPKGGEKADGQAAWRAWVGGLRTVQGGNEEKERGSGEKGSRRATHREELLDSKASLEEGMCAVRGHQSSRRKGKSRDGGEVIPQP